jgi:hypothetical protein
MLNYAFATLVATEHLVLFAGFVQGHRRCLAPLLYAILRIFGILLLHQDTGLITLCFSVAIRIRPPVLRLLRVLLARAPALVVGKNFAHKQKKNVIRARVAACVVRYIITKTTPASNAPIPLRQLPCLRL